MWKKRYEGNKREPYIDLAFLDSWYWFPNEWSVPLFTESMETSQVAVHCNSDGWEAQTDFQNQFPPKIHIFQTCSWNSSTTTELLPMIPMVLQSHEYLSNDVWYDPVPQGYFRGRIRKQKHGKFQFLSPRAGIETQIPLLESPELSGFYEMFMMRFGTLLKIQMLTLPAPPVSLLGFICGKKCQKWCSPDGMLWPIKLDSVGELHSRSLSHLQHENMFSPN